MSERNKKMTVHEVVDEEDRLLLYAKPNPNSRSDILLGRYRVIASIKLKGTIKAGDKIEYEPLGVDFGMFVRILTEEDS